MIIDNGAHQLVKLPEQYEVIVTTNLNGDIISDLTSALVGDLGVAPSGSECAIFEAAAARTPPGSAPTAPSGCRSCPPRRTRSGCPRGG